MQRGFTLIELLAVILIFITVAAIAVPKIGDWLADADLDIAARELTADIRLLQQMTVNSGGTIPVMKFHQAAPYGYYTMLSPDGNKPARTFPSTVKMGRAADLSFSVNGFPTSPRTINIMKADNSAVRSVIIDAVGRVRIQ